MDHRVIHGCGRSTSNAQHMCNPVRGPIRGYMLSMILHSAHLEGLRPGTISVKGKKALKWDLFLAS